MGSQIIGSPETVRAGLQTLADRTGVDELMILTMAHDRRDRLASYEMLMAELTERPLTKAVVGASA
mgnify:CR=1 FL=1